MKTLEEVKEDYIKHVYEICGYQKKAAARILEISDRGLRLIMSKWVKKGWQDPARGDVKIEKVDDEKHLEWKAMPTNEERLRYRDMMLNATHLKIRGVTHCPERDK